MRDFLATVRRWCAAGLLALAGHAAAETTASCQMPTVPQFPLTSTWQFTRGGRTADSFSFQYYGYGEHYGKSVFSFTDDDGKAVRRFAVTPDAYDLAEVSFLRLGYVWAENGGRSGLSTMNLYFGGTLLATFTTTNGNGGGTTPGIITAQNGTILYSGDGKQIGSSVTIPPNGKNAINGADSSASDDARTVTWYYLQLPANAPKSGQLMVEDPGVPAANGLFDDQRIYLPQTAQPYLCLRKQQNSGPAGQSFTFNTTGLDWSKAGGASASAVTLTPPALRQSSTKTTVPARVTDPYSVTLTESAPGYSISRVDCDKPNDGAGLASVLSVGGLSADSPATITLKGLPFGVMTTCTVFNDLTTDLKDRAPTVTLAKTFIRKSVSDQVALDIRTPNTSQSLTTTDTSSSVSLPPVKDTAYFYQSYNVAGTVGLRIAYPTYTLSETGKGTTAASDYDVTYQCLNTTQNSTANLPGGTLSGTYSFTFQPTLDLVNLGDNVTCTITNMAKTGPLNITKTGPVVANPGSEVTYTITLTRKSSLPDTYTVDTPTVTDTYTNATFKSYRVVSGTLRSNFVVPNPTGPGGKLTFNFNSIARRDNTPLKVEVTLTMPDATATKALSAWVREVQNTASYTVAGYEKDATYTNNGAIAGVTTKLPLVEMEKTVLNVTAKETTATAANRGNPGDTLEYCITVRNYSDLPAENFTINDKVDTAKLKPLKNETDYGLTYGGKTVRRSSPFSENIGTIPAATPSGPGTGQMCFRVLIQ